MNGRLWTNAHQNVYQDDLSYTYRFISESDATDAYQSWSDYGGNEHTLPEFAGPLLVESAGAILAYLIDAGELVGTQQQNPNTQCPPNTHFVHLQGCQPGPGKGTPPTASMFVVNNCSASGQSCSANGDCCSAWVLESTQRKQRTSHDRPIKSEQHVFHVECRIDLCG